MDEEEEIQTEPTDPPAKAAAEALGMQEKSRSRPRLSSLIWRPTPPI